MEWIRIEDKLPEKGIPCLLYISYPKETMFNCRADPMKRCFSVIGGLRWDNKFISYDDQYSEVGLKYISHWMPLPDKPKD